MGKDEVHREKIVDQPSMTSVVTSEYFFMPGSDVAIHIKTFKFIVLFTIVGTSVLWAIGLWTNWYWRLLLGFLNLLLTNWWLGPSIVGVIILGVYVTHPRRKKEVQKSKEKTQQNPQSSP